LKRIKDLLPKSSRAGLVEDSRADMPQEDRGSGDEKGNGQDLYGLDALFDELGAHGEEREPVETTGKGKARAPPGKPEVPDAVAPGAPLSPEEPGSHIDTAPMPPRAPVPPGVSPIHQETSWLMNSVKRLEISVDGLRREVENLDGRQRATDKNIEDLLRIYELMSRQLRLYVTEGKPGFDGLRERGLPGGMMKGTVSREDFPYNGDRLTGEPEGQAAVERRRAIPAYRDESYRVPGSRYMLEKEREKTSYVLEHLRNDYATIVLLMRWVEFLFERVKRDKIPVLLGYYQDIGWISPEAKSDIMAYARGEVQDVNAYEPELDDSMAPFVLDENDNPILDDRGTPAMPHYRPMDDWKLSAEDHLKSLLFIKKIAGCRIDKDELNALEQDIKVMKYSLRRFHEV